MNVGTLTIEIAAGVARLQADMNDAKRVVTTATKETEAAVGFLKTALGVAEEDAAAAQRPRVFRLPTQPPCQSIP